MARRAQGDCRPGWAPLTAQILAAAVSSRARAGGTRHCHVATAELREKRHADRSDGRAVTSWNLRWL
eukprot:1445879-Alexandrium_andersonii.AAC.1